MAYNFEKQDDGNVAVFDGDKRIATGTSGFAKVNYGYSEPETTDPSMSQPTGIDTPTPAPVSTPAPTTPIPEAPAVRENTIVSATEQAKQTRAQLETTYKTQKDEIQKKIEESEANIAGITAKQDGLIKNDIDPLLQPFRADIETKERERLKVDENYFANQGLVEELDSLLTEGNNYIKQQQGLPVNQRVVSRKVAKAMDDVNARVGVIQAVMSARNGQIAQAYTMIDRSTKAITADRQDRLNYYKTLYDFYENQKDDEGKKVDTLDKDKKKFLDAEIALIENDLKQAEKNSQNIKDLMTDPDTAMFMGRAGITLNDTPEEVQKKMADQAARDEVTKMKNDLTAKGYTFSPVATSGAVSFEAGGKTLYFTPPAKAASDKVYDEKNLPGTIRNSIIEDLSDPQFATTYGEDPIKGLMMLYPEVNQATLEALRDSFYDYEAVTAELEDPNAKKWWQFWK